MEMSNYINFLLIYFILMSNLKSGRKVLIILAFYLIKSLTGQNCTPDQIHTTLGNSYYYTLNGIPIVENNYNYSIVYQTIVKKPNQKINFLKDECNKSFVRISDKSGPIENISAHQDFHYELSEQDCLIFITPLILTSKVHYESYFHYFEISGLMPGYLYSYEVFPDEGSE